MASRPDLLKAARSIRLVVEKTSSLEASLQETQLQDRLLLAADVLEAVAAKNR